MVNNQFLRNVQKRDTLTQNLAVSHSTTGSALLNYFANAGSYRDRDLNEIYADISACWAESPELTLKMILYLRNVTRKTYGLDSVQRGQGNRDESRKAFGWVVKYYPEIAYNNLILFIAAGIWKDLWHRDLVDILNHQRVYALIRQGMEDNQQRGLIAKYLPRIRSRNQRKNEYHEKVNRFAKGFKKFMGWTERDYRKFKSDPENTAHLWQRQMCANRWDEINFNRIPGKALLQFTNNRKDGQTTLERHNLEDKYLEWIRKQPVAKFTGYPFELLSKVSYDISLVQRETLNKQFKGLIELAKQQTGGITDNIWCALDTSGSMSSWNYYHTWSMSSNHSRKNFTPYDVCIGLGIYFSELNTGHFHNHVIMFDNVSRLLELRGEFVDKVQQIKNASTAWGGTNFQSVIDEIVRVRLNHPDIPIEDYPTVLLVVSDMQFDYAGSNQTNYEVAMDKLRNVGLPEIAVIWWQVNGQGGHDYPSTIDDRGTTLISGFDGAVITLLTGTEAREGKKVIELSPEEQMLVALNQDLYNLVNV